MKEHKTFILLSLAIVITGLFSVSGVCLAQSSAVVLPSEEATNISSEPVATEKTIDDSTNRMSVTSANIEDYPYIAIVTGDDVYVRSGPASAYYPVCKLKKDQEVIVTQVRPGKTTWSRVEPVPGSVAYISADYVEVIDEGTSSTEVVGQEVLTGVVTGNDVRVRAGGVDMAPDNAYRILMLAAKGQQVSILGKQGDFYKIVPPSGSYFWVSSEFLKRKANVSVLEMTSLRDTTENKIVEKAVAPGELQTQYIALKDVLNKYDAVQAKALMDRDYATLRIEVQQLAANTDSPAVKSTAEVILKNIMLGESAQKQVTASIEQDKKIDDAMLVIDQAVVQALKEITPVAESPDVIVIKGKLEKSAVFTSGVSRRFIILDDGGLITCYVSGDGLEQYIGKQVSVSGPVSYDPFGKTRVIEAIKVVEVTSN